MHMSHGRPHGHLDGAKGRMLIASMLALALMGCKTKQERHDAFVVSCAAHKFAPEQCEFLFAVDEQQSDNADDAALLGAAMPRR